MLLYDDLFSYLTTVNVAFGFDENACDRAKRLIAILEVSRSFTLWLVLANDPIQLLQVSHQVEAKSHLDCTADNRLLLM